MTESIKKIVDYYELTGMTESQIRLWFNKFFLDKISKKINKCLRYDNGRFIFGNDFYCELRRSCPDLLKKSLFNEDHDDTILGFCFDVELSDYVHPRFCSFEYTVPEPYSPSLTAPVFNPGIITPPVFHKGIITSINIPIPSIKDVIFNPPATIVLWSDGSKTVVKDQEFDELSYILDTHNIKYHFDKEKGLAMAICKKVLGTNKSKSNYYEIFKKYIEEDN